MSYSKLDSKIQKLLLKVESGNVGNSKTARVLQAIKQNFSINTDELKKKLNMPHQTLTSAVSNLMDMGVVQFSVEAKDDESGCSSYGFVSKEENILANQIKRQTEKYVDWLKRGINEFHEMNSQSITDWLKMKLDKINESSN
jgi:predicted transcriptional regulator